MSAQTVITCDSCGAHEITRNGMSPSNVRRWRLVDKGWKSKRSRKFVHVVQRGTVYERGVLFTEALDFCPDCVALGYDKTISAPII